MQTHDALTLYFCPAGNGVFTVNTAKEKKAALHQRLYQCSDADQVNTQWLQQLSGQLTQANNSVSMLGICSDTGGGILRGANWGPLLIRQALYDQFDPTRVNDLGDIRVIPHLLHDKYLNEDTLASCREALYGDANSELAVSPLSITEDALVRLYASKTETRLFGLGGDHSVSYPLTKTFLQARRAAGKRVALIHFDAHTDLLDKRLGIDLCFGSWTYHILPLLEKPSHLIQLGIRSSGKDKTFWEGKFGITQHWAQDIQQQGIETLCQQSIDYLRQEGIDEIYISFDIDAIDAEFVSATGTPEPNGMSPQDAYTAIRLFSENFPLTGADLVEVAPFISASHAGSKTLEPQSTLTIAANLCEQMITAMAQRS